MLLLLPSKSWLKWLLVLLDLLPHDQTTTWSLHSQLVLSVNLLLLLLPLHLLLLLPADFLHRLLIVLVHHLTQKTSRLRILLKKFVSIIEKLRSKTKKQIEIVTYHTLGLRMLFVIHIVVKFEFIIIKT